MNRVRLICLVTALATGFGAPVAAQEREGRRDQERRVRELRAELRQLERDLGRSGGSMFFGPNLLTFSSNRARLGVVVRTAADEEMDQIGAVLESVDAGSAADEAGLEAGDIIVSFGRGIDPIRIAHRLDAQRTWLYTGLFDEVVPPANAAALGRAAKLDREHHQWFPGGHYSSALFLPWVLHQMLEKLAVPPVPRTAPVGR